MPVHHQVSAKSSKLSNSNTRSARLGLVNICLAIAIGALIITETIMTNTQVAIGSQSNALLSQQTQLADQVSQLTKDVSHFKSLQYINQQATQNLKMEPLQKNFMYLPSPEESK